MKYELWRGVDHVASVDDPYYVAILIAHVYVGERHVIRYRDATVWDSQCDGNQPASDMSRIIQDRSRAVADRRTPSIPIS